MSNSTSSESPKNYKLSSSIILALLSITPRSTSWSLQISSQICPKCPAKQFDPFIHFGSIFLASQAKHAQFWKLLIYLGVSTASTLSHAPPSLFLLPTSKYALSALAWQHMQDNITLKPSPIYFQPNFATSQLWRGRMSWASNYLIGPSDKDQKQIS